VTLSFLPTLNEAFMLCSAGSLAAGWVSIRRHRVRAHRALMLTAALLGVLFFLSYVAHTALQGDTTFGGPAAWNLPYQAFLLVHVTLATVAGVLGVLTLRLALRRRFHAHRRIAPWTARLWLVAAGSGLVVFLMLYVVFPPGGSANVVRVLTR
jgi:putative membrane protein